MAGVRDAVLLIQGLCRLQGEAFGTHDGYEKRSDGQADLAHPRYIVVAGRELKVQNWTCYLSGERTEVFKGSVKFYPPQRAQHMSVVWQADVELATDVSARLTFCEDALVAAPTRRKNVKRAYENRGCTPPHPLHSNTALAEAELVGPGGMTLRLADVTPALGQFLACLAPFTAEETALLNELMFGAATIHIPAELAAAMGAAGLAADVGVANAPVDTTTFVAAIEHEYAMTVEAADHQSPMATYNSAWSSAGDATGEDASAHHQDPAFDEDDSRWLDATLEIGASQLPLLFNLTSQDVAMELDGQEEMSSPSVMAWLAGHCDN